MTFFQQSSAASSQRCQINENGCMAEGAFLKRFVCSRKTFVFCHVSFWHVMREGTLLFLVVEKALNSRPI